MAQIDCDEECPHFCVKRPDFSRIFSPSAKTWNPVLFGHRVQALILSESLHHFANPMSTRIGDSSAQEMVNRLVLLAVAPLMPLAISGAESDDDDCEATSFTAECHLKFFNDTLAVFGTTVADWCVCFIGDNASVNLKLARISETPHVSCLSHKLNLELNQMASKHIDLGRTIDHVHDTMKSVKTRLKNSAVLRNLTDLRPVMHNQTRWSGKISMLKRYGEIHEELVEASNHTDAEIPIHGGAGFITKVNKYTR
eukprot:IDg22474t1